MSVFSNRLEDAAQEAGDYTTAILALLKDRDPLEVLAELPEAVRSVIDGLSQSDLRRPEAEGKWSMLETLHHLADSDLVWAYRMRCVVADADPRLTGYDQDRWAQRLHYADAKLDEVLLQLLSLRKVNLGLLRRLTPEELARAGRHTERGSESVSYMIRLYAGHDLVHLKQLRRIREGLAG